MPSFASVAVSVQNKGAVDGIKNRTKRISLKSWHISQNAVNYLQSPAEYIFQKH